MKNLIKKLITNSNKKRSTRSAITTDKNTFKYFYEQIASNFKVKSEKNNFKFCFDYITSLYT